MTYSTVPIDGGLDLVTAPVKVKPGRLIDCQNYEVARQKGIRRMDGYELYDGGASPSFHGNFEVSFQTTNPRPGGNVVANFAIGTVITFQYVSAGIAGTAQAVVTSNLSTYSIGFNQTSIWFYCYVVSGAFPGNSPAITGSVQAGAISSGSGTFTTLGIGGPFNSVILYLAAQQTVFSTVSATIQPVPGQGNVNGIFYLKDKVYAARDYYAVNFTTGLVRPNAGDVMFIGANLGAATWTGTVAKVVVTSGGWTSDLAGTGDAAGLFMVYNTTGTLTNASINNSTQGSVASMTGTGNNTASQAAGLYVATGTRGATTALASWQWCDLGYNIQYDTGIAAFQNQNTSATAAAQAAKYVTTAWKTATTPTTAAGRGQWLSVGTAYPLNLSDNDTANYVDHTFNTTPTTGLLQLTGFGFTNADIPSSASITGIEIQIYRAATGLTGNYTSDVIDKTLQLVNVANVKNPPNLADTTNNWGVVAKSAPITADTYILKDYGAPSAVPLTPTSLMGYDGITATDITSANFGINFNCQLSGSTTGQVVAAFVTQVQMRFSYIPQVNKIYFWDGKFTQNSANDGTMSANSKTLTSATAAFTANSVGQTVTVSGAGAAGVLLTATIAIYNSATSVTLNTPASTAVTTATIKMYTPVVAQVVQSYTTDGTIAASTAKGTVYLHFVKLDATGTVGGTPVRAIGSGEQIRTFPLGGQSPDGGVSDGSGRLATLKSGANQNVMDWSLLLAGVLQSDGSTAPAGKYQAATKNFYAASGFEAIYGVSGGGPAFMYDGIKTSTTGTTVPGNFTRILTGLALDQETPRSVATHQGHLYLGYYSGIVQQSNLDNVLYFDPSLGLGGAQGYGMSDRVTGMATVNGDTLAVWTQKSVQVIQGQVNVGNAVQLTISPTSGGLEYTPQPMTNFMYADFRGITMIGTTQKYGDFEVGHVSAIVAPFLVPRLQTSAFLEAGNTGVINSVLIRNKNQYRLFFADGYAMTLSLLVDGEEPQFTIQRYFKADGTTPVTWDVIQAFTESTGRDRIFGATADGTGNVFELERSNTFNSGVIPAYAILVPDHITDQSGLTAWSNKDFRDLHVYGRAQDYATFTVSRSGNYDAPNTVAANLISQIFGSSTATPTGNTTPFLSNSVLQITGRAVNIRVDSGTGSDPSATTAQFPHVIQAVEYDVTPLQPQIT